jgi:thioredoxin-related protein
MHNRRLFFILIALFLIGFVAKPSAFAGEKTKGEITWLKYDAAIEEAKKHKKHVLVDFATSWCGWCKKMMATTYKDSQVVNTIGRDFVAAMVDGESYNVLRLKDGDITEKGLTVQYGVRGYPMTWFLEPDANKIAPVSGYLDASQLMPILNYIRTNANDKMSFKEYMEKQTLKAGTK